MIEILILLFGEQLVQNIHIIHIDGREWYVAYEICKLLEIKDVSAAMSDRNNRLNIVLNT